MSVTKTIDCPKCDGTGEETIETPIYNAFGIHTKTLITKVPCSNVNCHNGTILIEVK